jgi:hypothetical protein
LLGLGAEEVIGADGTSGIEVEELGAERRVPALVAHLESRWKSWAQRGGPRRW